MIRIPLGALQVSAVETYVCDPVHDCESCELDGSHLVVHDAGAAWRDVVDGANSADVDVERGVDTPDLRDALTRLSRRLSRLCAT